MPKGGVEQIPHEEILSLEEIFRIVRIMEALGVRKVRLTGGEPLVRKNLCKLVEDIHGLCGIEEIAMTTNGVLFPKQAKSLKEAGLSAVNFSLDTMDPCAFRKITGVDAWRQVMEAIEEAIKKGFKVKVNCVPVRELNGKDIIRLAELAREREISLRYIELMPIGCGREFQGIPSEEILKGLEEVYGPARPEQEISAEQLAGPAAYYNFEGFKGKIGFISPMSNKFCDRCNRVRLTAEGRLKLCLHYDFGLELKPLLRGGASDEEIRAAIIRAVADKPGEHHFHRSVDAKKELQKEPTEEGEQAITHEESRRMVQIGG